MCMHAWNVDCYIYAPFSLKLDLKLKVVTGQVADGDARDIVVAMFVNPEKCPCQ